MYCICVGEYGGYGDIVMAMKILNYLKTRVEVRLYCYKRSAELKCRTVITDFEDYFIDTTDTYDFDVTIMVALPRLYNHTEIRSKRYIYVTEYNEEGRNNNDYNMANYSVIYTGFSKTKVTLTLCTPILTYDVNISSDVPLSLNIPFIPNGLYHYAYNSVSDKGNRIDSYSSYYWLNRYLLFMESLYKQQNDTCTVLLYGNNDPNKVLMDVIDKDYNKVTFKNDLLHTNLEFYPDGYAILYYGCLRVVMCHYPVSHKRSVTLLANSQEPLFVTGDQTLTEALSVGKMFMYQQFTWKYALVDAFIENINAYITDTTENVERCSDGSSNEYVMEFFKKSMYRENDKSISEQVDDLVNAYNLVNKSVFIDYCEQLCNNNQFYDKLLA